MVAVCTRRKRKGRRTCVFTKGEALSMRQKFDILSTLATLNVRRGNLIGESFPHRLYLADCWLTSLYVKLATGSDGIENIISLIQDNCQSLHKSPKRQGTNKVDCRTICEPVLAAKGTANGSFCLCSCSRHREACPVHQRAPLYHCIQ